MNPMPPTSIFTPGLAAAACRPLSRSPVTSRRFARIVVQAPSRLVATQRPPVHVAFVIDRSGSMMGDKLSLACAAVDHALGLLNSDDRFAIVAFDNRIDVTVAACPATATNIAAARKALAALESGNTTNISDAWIEGCQQIAGAAGAGPVLRTLLLTDGQANAGITSISAFAPHLAALRERGVVTTAFGLGLDFDEEFLAGVARAGGGNFYFIRDASLIAAYFTKELGESLEIVARAPVVTVTSDSRVSIKVLSDFASHRRQPGVLEVPLPDLASAQTLELIVSIDIPPSPPGSRTSVAVAISDPDGVYRAVRPVSFGFEAASHELNDLQPRNVEVDRAVARIFAAKAERDAVRYNRRNDFDRAREVLTSTRMRVASYAGNDAELSAILTDLKLAADRYAAPLDELSRKDSHATTIYKTRSRGDDGTSKRGGK